MLDSGAFSAWTKDAQVDIYKYIQFIKDHAHCIDHYFVLDVISAKEERDAEAAAKATWENQTIMEAEGLNPIPVFHAGEDLMWLREYIIKGHEYIGIGGLAMTSTGSRHPELDRIFRTISDPQGYPQVKLHGFAITSLDTMITFPWYSVDSTSWVLTSRFGTIYVPQWDGRDWDYSVMPWKIAVSVHNPKKDNEGQHVTTMKRWEQKIIYSYLKLKGLRMGHSEFDDDGNEIIHELGLCNHYVWRDRANIIYFSDLEANFPTYPWPYQPKGTPPLGVSLR